MTEGEVDAASRVAAAVFLWAQPSGRRPGPKPKYTLDGIAEAAIAIADESGLDEVTMQRVAERLGTTKMALYRYVPGRAELDAVMLDTALGAPVVAEEAHWRPALMAWATGVHDRAMTHPWIVELVQRPHTPGPRELAWFEAGLGAMVELPLRGGEKLDLLTLLVGHVMSLVRQRDSSGAPEQQLATNLASILATRAELYPWTASAFAEADDDGARDDALRFGVERVLDGVASLVAERAASSSSRS
ncbi:TetR family transcriptional regulator [Agromyces sp. Root1464]|uniref:TetR/AcrR family transcriptional regulator n=1 Tax=Agromyces sp. Root1464 TaxID=1736467 RepID=UPI0006F52D66|nr:TetR/AcrR family transcriptional regulator C-terminal domain-containing protein [Agromyces sp. Root1464]KQZ10668.1 TetR family transcriptional regulator [Agromyces sp. Root1464]